MKIAPHAALGRRAFLRGLGVGTAVLPLLSRPAKARRISSRLICVVQTGGYVQPDWQPSQAGVLPEPLPAALAPLGPLKGSVLVLPELIPAGPAAGNRYGSLFHGQAADAGPFPAAAGATLDQVVAGARGGRQRTLALGVQLDLAPQLDRAPGYRHAFWTAANAPVTPELDPVATYARLFGGGATRGTIDPMLAEGRSILDYVKGSLTRFRRKRGSEDRLRIDAHHEAVRHLEGQLTTAGETGAARFCGNGDLARGRAPLELDRRANYAPLVDLQLELLLAALKCGVTNVATLQLSDATGANLDPGFAGVLPRRPPFISGHDLARATDAVSVRAKRALDLWYMTRFARLVTDLQTLPGTGGENFLAETVVVWANAEYDGRTPEVARIPLLVASGSGGLAMGQAFLGLRSLPGTLAAVAEQFGATAHPFGPALPELKR